VVPRASVDILRDCKLLSLLRIKPLIVQPLVLLYQVHCPGSEEIKYIVFS
jgi:hypothetical protein